VSVESIAARQSKLIRKALDAVILIGPNDATPVASITAGATRELATIPAAYRSLGHHTEDDGINWSRDVNTEEVRSHGSQEPTRRDITSDVTGLHVIAQETKALTLELFHGVDLSAVTPAATTGEIAFNRARVASTRYFRLLAVSQDGEGDDLLYFARFLPRVSITDFAEQAWTKGTELQYDFTFTAYVDGDLGYAMREMWGGPGITALSEDMGFTTPTP
jgi:hypothetical protein